MAENGSGPVGLVAKRGNLTAAVIQQLQERVQTGVYTPGQKLPSQEELCEEFHVSRTVLREAVASLKQSGHLLVRQGAGIFVAEARSVELEFGSFTTRDVTTALQILELRLGVEVEQVGLAAQRRTPAALSAIAAAFDRFNRLDGSDVEALAQADFDFHLAIAQATQNPQFGQFLNALGTDIFLDLRLKHSSRDHEADLARKKKNGQEHAAILSAISTGDVEAARQAVRLHLGESLARYRRAVQTPGAADSDLDTGSGEA